MTSRVGLEGERWKVSTSSGIQPSRLPIAASDGVAFDEAEGVFYDPNAKPEYDEAHSQVEDRWLVIGVSSRLRLLTVAYTKRDDKTIRIISARRANQAEEGRYAQ